MGQQKKTRKQKKETGRSQKEAKNQDNDEEIETDQTYLHNCAARVTPISVCTYYVRTVRKSGAKKLTTTFLVVVFIWVSMSC